jgi:hypothetical protein
MGEVQDKFGVDDLQEGGADQALTITADRTDTGGSSFSPPSPTSPTGFAMAVITVLFRPFPFEASNVGSLLASVEGTALGFLCLLSLPRFPWLFRNIRTRPYVVLALTYTLTFCYAFASIGNFGILTRQRTQVIPLLLVLICLPRASDVIARPREHELQRAYG